MEQLLLELLQRLEAIGERDESLFDTVVRDCMSRAISDGFIQPLPGFVLADDYEMGQRENQEIKEALRVYISRANELAAAHGLNDFRARLAAFQNGDVRTEHANYYDDFFGWCNPDLFDSDGNVVPRT